MDNVNSVDGERTWSVTCFDEPVFSDSDMEIRSIADLVRPLRVQPLSIDANENDGKVLFLQSRGASGSGGISSKETDRS